MTWGNFSIALILIGIWVIAVAAIIIADAWPRRVFVRAVAIFRRQQHLVLSHKERLLLTILLSALAAALFVLAIYWGGAPRDCSGLGSAGCAKLGRVASALNSLNARVPRQFDRITDRLNQIDRQFAKASSSGRSAQNVEVQPYGPPSQHALSREDLNAIASRVIEKATSSRLLVPVVREEGTNVWYLLVIVALIVLAAVLWFTSENPLTRKFGRISAILALVAALLTCVKNAGDAGASWAWLWSKPTGSPTNSYRVEVSPPSLILDQSSASSIHIPTIPIFFAKNATRDTAQGKSQQGIEIAPAYDTILQELVMALAECGNSQEHVLLTIRGFASSSEFQYLPASQSNDLNLIVANKRADAAAKKLLDALTADTSKRPVVDYPHWPTFEQMKLHRPYNDSGDGKKQEMLNRVAMIELTGAGHCKVP